MSGIRTLIVGLFLATGLFAQVDFLPLDNGNQWVYRGEGAIFTVEVGIPLRMGDKEYFIVSGMPLSPALLLRRDNDGRVYYYDVENKQERLYLDLVSDRAATGVAPCAEVSAVESREAKVTTPIGSFESAVLVRYESSKCADAGISADYFLPSVGLIRRVLNTIAGPKTFDLIYAKLGTVTVIREPETSFGIALAPVMDRRVAQNLTVRLTLRRTARLPTPMPNTWAQSYEIVVYNSKGEQIYTWSTSQPFPTGVKSTKFNGEQNWTELIPVKDWPVGHYVVKAWVTTPDGIDYEAMAPFDLW